MSHSKSNSAGSLARLMAMILAHRNAIATGSLGGKLNRCDGYSASILYRNVKRNKRVAMKLRNIKKHKSIHKTKRRKTHVKHS